MFERTFALREYDAETPFSTAAGLEVLPVRLPHYRLETYGFRVTNGDATLAYTGDTGPERADRRARPRRRPVRLRGDARDTARPTASRAGT